MKLEDAKRELTCHFQDLWKDDQGNFLTPIIYENEEIKSANTEKPWVRFAVEIFSFSPDSMGCKGNRRVKRFGALYIQVFVPLNHKTSELNALLNKVVRMYEGEHFNGVYFRHIRTNLIAEEQDSAWYGRTVRVPLEFVEII